jgi:hypothetical protein
LQEGPDEFAVAADGHAGKFLEPRTFRHFRFSAKPICQQAKLVRGNIPAADAIEQMIEKVWRKIVAPDAWHGYSP